MKNELRINKKVGKYGLSINYISHKLPALSSSFRILTISTIKKIQRLDLSLEFLINKTCY